MENYNEKPLKGILKKTSSFAEEEEIEIRNGCIRFCSCILIIIICVPIIVCDLYFGFTDISCINEIATGLNFTMKIYLLVSGFTGFITMLITICIVYSLSDTDYRNDTILISVKYFGAVFQIIWNILGAATFWGTIYKEGKCDLNISTYIYVSLIVKMVSNLISLRQILKNK